MIVKSLLILDEAVAYDRKGETPGKNINAILNSKGDIRKEFSEKWKKELKAIDEQLEKNGVFTLSESNNNILLWSHYADGHRGFCIEFVRDPDNQLGNYEITRRVQYRIDYPIINPIKDDAFGNLKFFTKASDWAYEREWRLVYDEGDIEESLRDADISAIIFGLKMAESHKEVIRKVTSDLPNIKYRQAVKVPDRFELEIEDI